MLSQIEQLGSEGYRAESVAEIKQEAARRGIELLKRGGWKPDRDDWGWLEDVMQVALETLPAVLKHERKRIRPSK